MTERSTHNLFSSREGLTRRDVFKGAGLTTAALATRAIDSQTKTAPHEVPTGNQAMVLEMELPNGDTTNNNEPHQTDHIIQILQEVVGAEIYSKLSWLGIPPEVALEHATTIIERSVEKYYEREYVRQLNSATNSDSLSP